MRDLKWPVRHKKDPKFCKSFGILQSVMVVNFVRSGLMPSGPTLPPAKVASIIKNFDFVTERDSLVSLICHKSLHVFPNIISKSSPARPPSSTNNSISVPMKSPRAFPVILLKEDSAPVRLNGIHLYA